ncbi:MAG: glycosyltransferase family 29 protein [Desulfobacterales bacterium]|nr:glycosyltransferase family 29 protein [Desulfobacterales bacterium]
MNSIVADLYGKKICLVGPSPSLKDSGQLIDSYDIVVRMNSALPAPEELHKDIGLRTDILITGLAEDYMCHNSRKEDYKERMEDVYINYYIPAKASGLKYIVVHHPAYTRFTQKQYAALEEINNKYNDFTLVYIPLDIHKQIRNATQGEPCTGTLAIDYLMQFKIKELFVTGFTFFKDGYYESYHPSMPIDRTNKPEYKESVIKSGHSVDEQLKYLERYKKPVFHPDDVLTGILGWNKV